ncbi:hypothetical protein QBC46DRAFT_134483 [Diplogelasinospora grovesii]|uniref:Uncharacterized protein n=1 Tax=Diplogelasinospora grovesii TaxID=303347 RepID=A0AAN6NHD9_9PEZI|nr:hypothetical protein QBC46DRAFT_134483 [Diplogelasinospora grovesii]
MAAGHVIWFSHIISIPERAMRWRGSFIYYLLLKCAHSSTFFFTDGGGGGVCVWVLWMDGCRHVSRLLFFFFFCFLLSVWMERATFLFCYLFIYLFCFVSGSLPYFPRIYGTQARGVNIQVDLVTECSIFGLLFFFFAVFTYVKYPS